LRRRLQRKNERRPTAAKPSGTPTAQPTIRPVCEPELESAEPDGIPVAPTAAPCVVVMNTVEATPPLDEITDAIVVVRGGLAEELLGVTSATMEVVVDLVEVEPLLGEEDEGVVVEVAELEIRGDGAVVGGDAGLDATTSDRWPPLLTGSPFPVIRLGAGPDVGVDPEEPMKAMILPSGNWNVPPCCWSSQQLKDRSPSQQYEPSSHCNTASLPLDAI